MRSFLLFNRLILSLLLFVSTVSINAQSELEYELDKVVVTAGRTPVTFSNLTRTVNVISKEEIENSPVNSIPDLLQYISGVDVKQRGTNGVQADVSIRGGTFEQTLILIDGIKITDPQTGHHNMNLPISLEEVEKVEVLKGQGSQIYGANAFSGVINIITKKGEGTSLNALIEGGENGYYNLSLGGNLSYKRIDNRISVSKKQSDGYRHNTGFETVNFTYRPTIRLNNGSINLFGGYTDNKFGANSFYSSRFPNQWEQVKTTLISGSSNLAYGSLSIIPKLYWRKNEDEFLLDFDRPEFYRNIHKTYSYGGEIQGSYSYNVGVLSVGAEYGKDEITSSNLGEHWREKMGFFAEQTFSNFGDFTFNIGGFAYNYSSIGWQFWPGIDLGYKLNKSARVYASYGKAFRIPSFTDLYYRDPVTVGNPNLEHEESTNYEVGIYYDKRFYDFNVSLFLKDGNNMIDYVQNIDDNLWYAMNINEITTQGIEVNFTYRPSVLNGNFFIDKITLAYTYINSDKKNVGVNSRYVLEHLEHQAVLGLFHKIPFDIWFNWGFRYEKRIEQDGYFLTDINISKKIDYFEFYVKGTNIFNEPYFDINNLPLPGRWMFAGVKFGL